MGHKLQQTAVMKREMTHLKDNSYYIDLGGHGLTAYRLSERELVLIDCGIGMGDCDELIELIDRMGMRVTSMLASHCHIDHVGGANKLREKYGTRIVFPALEADACRSYRVLKSNYPFASLRTVQKFFGGIHCEPDEEYAPIDHDLNVDGAVFKIIQTPGHSVANTCIITPDNVMHMGDTVMGSYEMEHNRLAYTCVVDMAMESMEKIRDIKCDKYVVSHNGVYEDVGAVIDENIKFHERTAGMIERLITRPMSIDDIIAAFYDEYGLGGRDMVTCTLIERSLRPYVEYLWDLERVNCVCEKGVIKYVKRSEF